MGAPDIDRALRLLEAAPPSAFTLMAEASTVLAHEGVRPPAASPALARSLYEVRNDSVALDRFDLPEQLDGVIGAEKASELADILHHKKRLPHWNRLPRLLAADQNRLTRLIRDSAELVGARSLSWAQCVSEAMMGCVDAGTEPPTLLKCEFQALTEATTPHSVRIEGYQARLRLAARRDPEGALSLLKEACWEVGAYEVEHGLEAVLGRLAAIDRNALHRYLSEQTDSFAETVLAFRAGLGLTIGPADLDRLDVMVDQLERTISPNNTSGRDIWAVTFELLWAAARLGAFAAARRIIRVAGPPAWTVLNATWAPVRRRSLEGDTDAIRFLDDLAGALEGAGSGPASLDQPPPPDWSQLPPPLPADYWRLRALPLKELPWWTPWGASLP